MRASTELESGKPMRDIWLKAFAHSDGSKNSANAKYLLFRSQQLRDNYQKELIAKATSTAISTAASTSRIIVSILLCVAALLIGLISIFGILYSFVIAATDSIFGGVAMLLPSILCLYGAGIGLKRWGKALRIDGIFY